MGFDDTRTEFFGSRKRAGWGGGSKRARAKAPGRRHAPRPRPRRRGSRPRRHRPGERGLSGSSEVLLEHITEEDSELVLATIARAVLDVPPEPQPARDEAQLRAWALAELNRTRRGAMAPAPMTGNAGAEIGPVSAAAVVSGPGGHCRTGVRAPPRRRHRPSHLCRQHNPRRSRPPPSRLRRSRPRPPRRPWPGSTRGSGSSGTPTAIGPRPGPEIAQSGPSPARYPESRVREGRSPGMRRRLRCSRRPSPASGGALAPAGSR